MSKKRPGILANTKLTVSQQCALSAKKVSSFLGCSRIQHFQQVQGGDPLLLLDPGKATSGIVCPVLDKRDIDILEQVQQKTTKMINRLGHL